MQYFRVYIIFSALLLTFLAGALVFTDEGVVASDPVEPSEEYEFSVEASPTPVLNTSAPARVQIPAIRADARVQGVGINKKGNIGVLASFDDIGWYRNSALPGKPGNVILNGHYDDAVGLAGVFKNLEDLEPGDLIVVQNGYGEEFQYAVSEVASVPYNAEADAIFSADMASRLVLITCAGDWLSDKKTYERRTIVFAEMV